MTTHDRHRREDPSPTNLLGRVLDLETVEVDLYRAAALSWWAPSLYGGQVAAQSLLAAGRTVDPGRRPHSLHGYFLRKGDPDRPTLFQVFRDRDGRSFSARRVVALQNGEVIFNMSASFHLHVPGAVSQVATMPEVEAPQDGKPFDNITRFAFEGRLPTQPYDAEWPTLFWARTETDIGDDPLVHACALTYLSDVSTGILPAPDGTADSGASLDHAVWFHRPVDMTRWTLTQYRPQVAGAGRGWYTGSVFTEDGSLVASIAQECLFR